MTRLTSTLASPFLQPYLPSSSFPPGLWSHLECWQGASAARTDPDYNWGKNQRDKDSACTRRRAHTGMRNEHSSFYLSATATASPPLMALHISIVGPGLHLPVDLAELHPAQARPCGHSALPQAAAAPPINGPVPLRTTVEERGGWMGKDGGSSLGSPEVRMDEGRGQWERKGKACREQRGDKPPTPKVYRQLDLEMASV